MAIFNGTPSESTLDKAAYCVLYEVIKEGVRDITELRESLRDCVSQCDSLSIDQREELKPIYERAYEIAFQNSFDTVKKLAKQVGSDFSKDL